MRTTSNAQTLGETRREGVRRRDRIQLAATGAVFLFVAAVILGVL
jgi:hypothetical protein